ncbi:MAG: class E sortase [Actinomycetota bacterium]|nr:class E sortase [Actinomycetota bacterium]
MMFTVAVVRTDNRGAVERPAQYRLEGRHRDGPPQNRIEELVLDKLVAFLSDSRRARRTLTAVVVALVVAAAGLIGYPAITNLVHNNLQDRLANGLDSAANKMAYERGTLGEGAALTRIMIPHIGVDAVVVQGISDKALEAGSGHYPQTPLPCETGDVAIAGHRTTYGKPFANVDRLRPGDQITLATPVGSCVYRIARAPFVVAYNDVAVVANTPSVATLTLTACHPKGSASHRMIIKADMVSSELG